MKIRFYHWWIYKLYKYFWNPIYREKPILLQAQIDHANKWIKENKND